MGTRRRAWVAGAGLALVVVVLGTVAAWPRTVTPPSQTAPPSSEPGVTPPSGPSTDPGTATGPIVYYELVDATASRLYSRTLDGRSGPREIASRDDVAMGPAWSVDPTDQLAVVVVDGPTEGVDGQIVAYRIADGSPAWTATVGATQADWLRWSADGRSLATLIDAGGEDLRTAALIDAATGAVRRVDVPGGAALLGWDDDGAPIVWDVLDDGAAPPAFRFFRIDPVTLAVERLTSLPAIGPDVNGSRSIDPRVGASVELAGVDEGPGTEVRLRDLRTSATRVLATVPTADLVAIDPLGTGVVVTANGTARYIAFDGSASDIFSSESTVNAVSWSADGAFLLVRTDDPADPLTVVERASGRGVTLPLPRIADAHFVAMPAGPPLPPAALPADEPGPTPTPAPSGPDVGGFPPLLLSWTAPEDGRLVAHAQRVVPTDDGGIRVAADMPPIDLGAAPTPDDASTSIRLLPRPGTSDILVWITSDEASHGMVWDGGGRVTPLVLPPGWPAHGDAVAWRPDGEALAASVGEETPDGGFRTYVAIAAPGGERVTKVPFPGDYDQFEGWWSNAELRLGHAVCTEGCPGRYSYSARLRVSDRRLTPLTPRDRGHQPIDVVYTDRGQVVLAMANEAPETDIRVAWPASLGPEEKVAGSIDADGRSLIVSRTVGHTTEIYRVEDVVGRAAGGVVADPRPVLIGTLPLPPDDVQFAPGDGWAVIRDRVGDVSLVRLADGRSWPLEASASATWLPAR
jgi:hypothetical protein